MGGEDMQQWYNVTNIDFTNILTFTQGVNHTLMRDMFGTLLLIVLWVIAFINLNSMWQHDIKVTSMVATFFIALLSLFLFPISLIPLVVPFICWGLFAANIIWIFLSD
jgi:hypothetical protein